MADPTQEVEKPAETEGAEKETVKEEEAPAESKVEDQKAEIDPEKYEPEQRQRPWSNRQERAEYFKSKQKEAPVEGEEEAVKAEDTDISSLVKKAVDDALTPLNQRLADEADDREVRTFLSKPENARFAKYEALARKEMKVYDNLPVSKIFKALAFEDAERLGAEKASAAKDKQTRRSTSGTATRKSDSGLPDFRSMSPTQMEAFNKRVMKGETFQIDE